MRQVNEAILVYDADCGFCRWSVARILRWDRRRLLRPVAVQAPEADSILGDMPTDERMASWHLVIPGGAVVSGGDAVALLAERLPGGRAIAVLARAFPTTTRRLYSWVADHRDMLGRRLGTQACSVDPSASRGSGRMR